MPEDRERRLRESWDANASAWTEVVRRGRIESRVVATDGAVVAAVLDRGPRTVLDVGCGEGWLAARLADAGVRVTGFDASEELVRGARESAAGSFQVLDYESFSRDPLQLGGPFDVVVCSFSLLGADVRALLEALARVLVPGGKLIIQTLHPLAIEGDAPYADGWREEDFGSMGDGFASSMPWYFRTVGSWVRELRAAGLVVEECLEPSHPGTGRPLSLIWIAGT